MTYLLCWGPLIATCRCNDTFTISARPESIGRTFWRAIACGEPPLVFRGNRDKLNILKHDSELPNDGTPGEIAEKSPLSIFTLWKQGVIGANRAMLRITGQNSRTSR